MAKVRLHNKATNASLYMRADRSETWPFVCTKADRKENRSTYSCCGFRNAPEVSNFEKRAFFFSKFFKLSEDRTKLWSGTGSRLCFSILVICTISYGQSLSSIQAKMPKEHSLIRRIFQ